MNGVWCFFQAGDCWGEVGEGVEVEWRAWSLLLAACWAVVLMRESGRKEMGEMRAADCRTENGGLGRKVCCVELLKSLNKKSTVHSLENKISLTMLFLQPQLLSSCDGADQVVNGEEME